MFKQTFLKINNETEVSYLWPTESLRVRDKKHKKAERKHKQVDKELLFLLIY